MTIRRRLAAVTALGLLIASPASAGWGGSSGSGDHIHDCGCGHKDWNCKKARSSGGSSGGTPNSQPADFALFAIGVLGLIIGRSSSRARRS